MTEPLELYKVFNEGRVYFLAERDASGYRKILVGWPGEGGSCFVDDPAHNESQCRAATPEEAAFVLASILAHK